LFAEFGFKSLEHLNSLPDEATNDGLL